MLLSLNFNQDWKFIREFDQEMLSPEYDDSEWRTVDLPHDWSIEEKFDINSPTFCRGAWLPGGMGCYRKQFHLEKRFQDKDISLYFGGIFRNSEIWVNGHYAGGREWGFISFEVSIGQWLFKDKLNTIVVKVDNSRLPACRWYAGSGIYRNVDLVVSDRRIVIPRWGMYVLAYNEKVTEEEAEFYLKYQLLNKSELRRKVMVSHKISDASGKIVYEHAAPHTVGAGMEVTLADTVHLLHPRLWSPEEPNLYTVYTEVSLDGEVIDRFSCRTGLRSIVFDPDKGCLLNGRPYKIRGFGLHADGGALGSAISYRTHLRQLRILKGFGCNAVRTAHNPPGEDFLQACDEVGLLVLDEAFDEWQEPIRVGPFEDGEVQTAYVKYYADIFDRCARQDLTDFVLRDRNHPSVFMWSIGNEIPQMHKETGNFIVKMLVEIVHKYDEMRPVTSAVTVEEFHHGNIDCLDVGGYNYLRPAAMDMIHERHPRQAMLLTEDFSVRNMLPAGMYLPVGKRPDFGYTYPQAIDFVMRHADMKLGVDQETAIEKRPFVMGHFVWTGFDYLGEPTPYDWPAHSSFYGVFTTAGFPKDAAYFYQCMWRKELPAVHLCTSWDYEAGDMVDVKVFSNCRRAELFLNGRSLGSQECDGMVSWQVPFEPGELKVSVRNDAAGNILAEDAVYTSGKAARLKLTPYFGTDLKAGSSDIEYVTCELLDEHDHLVRSTDKLVHFKISGQGNILGVDNGNAMEEYTYQQSHSCHFCDGRCLCLVKPARQPGKIYLEAGAAGCAASLILTAVENREDCQ